MHEEINETFGTLEIFDCTGCAEYVGGKEARVLKSQDFHMKGITGFA